MAPGSAVTTAPTPTPTTTLPAASDSKQDLDTAATAEWQESEYNDAEFYDDAAQHEEEQWDEDHPHAGNDNTVEEAYDAGAGGGDEDWDYYEEDYGEEEGLDPDAPDDIAAADAAAAAAGDSTPTTTTTTMFDGLLEDGVKIGSEEKAGNKPPLSAQQKQNSLPQRPQPAPALPARPHPPPSQQHQQQQHPHPANYRARPHGPRPAGGYMPPQAHYDQFRPYGNRFVF
ncbi:hypothetical protein BDZ88DRAFT_411369 [Geranomyces variabilis]|nr:hypothetical protein BDZ88DRAFT_411369 [Geranomyces variabilis]